MNNRWIRVGALLAAPGVVVFGCGGTVIDSEPLGDDAGAATPFEPNEPATPSGRDDGSVPAPSDPSIPEPRVVPPQAAECSPREARICVCAGGVRGEQVCRNGEWGPCACPPGECGNGVLERGEMCDGRNLAGETCASATMSALPGGELRCSSNCTFDTSRCRGRRAGAGGYGGAVGAGGYAGAGGTFGRGGYAGSGGYGGTSGRYPGYPGRPGSGGYAGSPSSGGPGYFVPPPGYYTPGPGYGGTPGYY